MDFSKNEKELPYEQRKKLFMERLQLLCDSLDIDMVPVLGQSPGSIMAQILYIDLQNKKMLKEMGLIKGDPPKADDGGKLVN